MAGGAGDAPCPSKLAAQSSASLILQSCDERQASPISIFRRIRISNSCASSARLRDRSELVVKICGRARQETPSSISPDKIWRKGRRRLADPRRWALMDQDQA
jgi:hypothetical protein